MPVFDSIQQSLVAWGRAFDEGVAELPVIGDWFRPKWDILIAHGDGRFSISDAHDSNTALTPDRAQQMGQSRHLCLRLDHTLGQQRDIVLPEAARHDPAAAIALSSDQYFPFAPSETAFAVHGGARSTANGQMLYRVSFARSSEVQAIAAQAQALGLAPKAIDVLGADPLAPVSADLASGGPAGSGRSASRWLLGGCAALLLLAGLASLWSSLILAPRAAQFQTAGRRDGTDQALLQKRAKLTAPSVLNIWRAATHALPDNAHAQYLLYEKGHLRLAGTASDAAGLVEYVEAQKLFHGTAFAAASIKADDGKESFDLITSVHKADTP